MAKPGVLSTMGAWQYTSTKGGIPPNLKLNPCATIPKPKPHQHLVQILAVALNPIDYKPAEIPIVGRLIVPKLATPGIDFAGAIVTPAKDSTLKPGQLVFGCSGSSPLAGGALAEFNICDVKYCSEIPEGLRPTDASTIGVAAVTAYQSLLPKAKEGDRVFINGGSGGTGVFGIQIAKAVGCHVTTTCSTQNVEFCKGLGADEVVDYKTSDVAETLIASGVKFDHAVDNIGATKELFWRSHEFMKPKASYVLVGGAPTRDGIVDTVKRKVLPKFLGGIQGTIDGFWPQAKPEDLVQIAEWVQKGKIKIVIDEQFKFEEAPKALEKLKTGRARGKIVVDVASERYKEFWTES